MLGHADLLLLYAYKRQGNLYEEIRGCFMYLKKIEIHNYRQLQNVILDFQKNLTVLAGPNNSGKTTLISVLKGVLHDKSVNLSYGDIPTHLAIAWLDKVFSIFQKIMSSNEKEAGIQQIVGELSLNDSFKDDFIIPKFEVRIQVDYNKEADDIQNFADYIMDLDSDKSSFYFLYRFEPSISSFEKLFNEHYDKIKVKIESIAKENSTEKEAKTYAIKESLLKIYCSSLQEKVYFTNSTYDNLNLIDLSDFKKLFYFKNIQALRELDDIENDSSEGVSKRIISLLKNDDDWLQKTRSLPDIILNEIISSGAKTTIQESSVKSLDRTVQAIAKTSGGHVGKIQLEMDVNETDVEDFIQKITRAKYDIDGLLLSESSQGLGFSNLIYLHLRLEEYLKSVDRYKVNVFFVEEPEAHMHPQMQNIFIRYLRDFYIANDMQGLITTHSNEIVRDVGLENLRVLRQTEKSKSELFDLSTFKESLKGMTEAVDEDTSFVLENFFDWFFEIGYSEIVFADKAVLYEGDSERLYIRKLLRLDEFSSLKNSYIAFIQVGGNYAYNYKQLLEKLKIKTLIITDLDYDKEATTLEEAKQAYSSNSTINKFYNFKFKEDDKEQSGAQIEENNKKCPTLSELYLWQSSTNYKTIVNKFIYIAFQDEDSTARTLEEAMLSKLLSINVFTKRKRSEWQKIRKKHKIAFLIPRNRKDEEDSEFTIRDIVEATSGNKTDFMYSIILNCKEKTMLPTYIEKGLKWLTE